MQVPLQLVLVVVLLRTAIKHILYDCQEINIYICGKSTFVDPKTRKGNKIKIQDMCCSNLVNCYISNIHWRGRYAKSMLGYLQQQSKLHFFLSTFNGQRKTIWLRLPSVQNYNLLYLHHERSVYFNIFSFQSFLMNCSGSYKKKVSK